MVCPLRGEGAEPGESRIQVEPSHSQVWPFWLPPVAWPPKSTVRPRAES